MIVNWTNEWNDAYLNRPVWACYSYQKDESSEIIEVIEIATRRAFLVGNHVERVWFDTNGAKLEGLMEPKVWAQIEYPEAPSGGFSK
jgi:hypothetical protein